MSTGAFNITSPASARDTSDGLQLVDTNDGKNTRVNEQKGEHTYLPGAVENNEKSESVIGLSAVESFHLRAQQIVGWHIYDISQFLNQYNVNYTGVFSATDTSPFLRRLAPFSSTSFSSLASESIQSVRLYDEELNTITQFDANLVHSSPPSQETGKVEEERRTLVKRWSRQIDSNRGDVGEGGNYTDVLQLLLDQLTISDRNNKSMNGDDTRNSKGLTHTQAMRIADQALQFVYALKCRSDLEQEKGACWSVWKATSKILSSQLKQLSSLHLHLQHPIAQKESGHNDDSRNCSHHHHQPTHIHNRYKNQNYGHSIRHADNIDTHNPHLHHISGVSIGARGLEVGASGVQSSNHNTNDIGNNNNGHGDEGKAFREKMKGATNSNNTTQNCVKRKGDGLFSSSKSMANKSRAQSIHIDDADNEGEGGEAEMHRKMRRMYGDTSHSENDPNQAASVKLNDGSGSGKGSYSNKKEHGGEGSYGKGKDVSEHRVRNFKSVFVNHTDESDSTHNNGSATSLDRNGKSSGNHGQNNVNIHHASDQGNDAHHHEPSDEDRIMNVRTKAMISNQSDHEDSIPRFKHCLQRFFPPSLYDGYVIEPTNIYLVYWEVVVICVISIFYLQTPMDLAFRYNSSNLDLYSGSINAPYLLSYIILHIVLWVDNLLMLFLAYRTKSGEVSGTHCTCHYTHTYMDTSRHRRMYRFRRRYTYGPSHSFYHFS